MKLQNILYIVVIAILLALALTKAVRAEYRSYGNQIVDPQTGLSVYETTGRQRDQIMRNAVNEHGRNIYQNDNSFDSFDANRNYQNRDLDYSDDLWDF